LKLTIVLSVISLCIISCDSISNTKDMVKNNEKSINKANKLSELANKILVKNNCDAVLDNNYTKICYSFKYKAAKAVIYTLDGDLVNATNIKERPRFYEESAIPKKYRATYYDYKNSGYDRGHMAPDAAFDWSDESLHAIYTLANIVPQVPDVNQHTWVKAEEHARKEAVLNGTITVIDIVKYSNNPKRIGDDGIAVAEGFYKLMYNSDESYKECFYYKNEENTSKVLNSHLIDCNNLTLMK